MSEDLDNTRELLRLAASTVPTVLIVDDDELILTKLRDTIAQCGYAVRTAASGVEALRILEDFPASILVTDFKMPAMDGLELCRRVRSREWPHYIYIMLLTARDADADIVAGLEAGADDYLSKRTSSAQLIARLRTARRIVSLESSLRNALEKKRELAMTDPLTGTFNRRYLTRHLTRAIKRAQRYGGDVSVMMLDIDHFKRVNDMRGHVAGDRVLQSVAKQIACCLHRTTDWSARYGGEEFVIVLEGTDIAGAMLCAERVRRSISDAPIPLPGGSVQVTVSMGAASLATMPDRVGTGVLTLLDAADIKLYESKARGRNCVTGTDIPTPFSDGIRTTLQRWEHDDTLSESAIR